MKRSRETDAQDAARAVAVLDSRPGRGQPETIAVLASLIGGARERLWITTPYFAPPDYAIELLSDAVSRGVDVRLLVPGKTDVAIMSHAAHGAYTRMLRAGVHVFEYQPAVLHAKTMVVDGAVGMVGSANLDFRSFWYNAECNVLLFDEGTAKALEASFTTDLAESIEVTQSQWATRSAWHRFVDFLARGVRWAL